MMNKNPYQTLITPRTKKTAAKKVIQKAAGKTATRVGAKATGKVILRTVAKPWLLAADGVELGVGVIYTKLNMETSCAHKTHRYSGSHLARRNQKTV